MITHKVSSSATSYDMQPRCLEGVTGRWRCVRHLRATGTARGRAQPVIVESMTPRLRGWAVTAAATGGPSAVPPQLPARSAPSRPLDGSLSGRQRPAWQQRRSTTQLAAGLPSLTGQRHSLHAQPEQGTAPCGSDLDQLAPRTGITGHLGRNALISGRVGLASVSEAALRRLAGHAQVAADVSPGSLRAPSLHDRRHDAGVQLCPRPVSSASRSPTSSVSAAATSAAVAASMCSMYVKVLAAASAALDANRSAREARRPLGPHPGRAAEGIICTEVVTTVTSVRRAT